MTPEPVGFPGARLIARLQQRVRRHGKKSTETVYLISSLTLEQLDAAGWLKHKRGHWVIESRRHHALDVSLDEDRSRVRQPNAALVLGMFRRLVVSVAQTAIARVQTRKNEVECAPIPATLRPSRRRPRTPSRPGLRQIPGVVALAKMKNRVLSALRHCFCTIAKPKAAP